MPEVAPMFDRILVPLDGSPLAEQALPLVGKLLDSPRAKVTLLSVGDAPGATRLRHKGLRRPLPLAAAANVVASVPAGVIAATPPSYAESKDQAVERREHELLEYLDRVGRPLSEAGRALHAAVHFGEPAKEIVAFAEKGKFDVIVMATHGRSGLSGTLHGSVTAAVIKSGVAPVLVVRPKRGRPAGAAAKAVE
jgi:nucleotide-binding universal stress UspA family protein